MFKNILKVLSGSLLSSLMLCSVNSEDNISLASNYDGITPIGYDEENDLYCDWSCVNGDMSGCSSMSIDYYVQNANSLQGDLTFAFSVDKTKSDIFSFSIYFYEMEYDGDGFYQFTTSDELYDYQNMKDVLKYDDGLSLEEDGIYVGDYYSYRIDSSTLGNYLYFNLNTSEIGDCRFNIEYCGSDNVAPVITSTIDKIEIDIDNPIEITEEYLLGLNAFSVIDNVDGDITNNLTIKNHNIDYLKVGNYEMLLEWKDSSGNISRKTIDVEVISNTKDDSSSDDNSSNSDSSSSVWSKNLKTIWSWIVKFIQWIIGLFSK